MKNENIYKMVTDKIVAEMEKGIIPWQKPWKRVKGCKPMEFSFGGCISHTTGRAYSWLNQMMLGLRAGEWLTFNQCKAEGGCVKAGEKASIRKRNLSRRWARLCLSPRLESTARRRSVTRSAICKAG